MTEQLRGIDIDPRSQLLFHLNLIDGKFVSPEIERFPGICPKDFHIDWHKNCENVILVISLVASTRIKCHINSFSVIKNTLPTVPNT